MAKILYNELPKARALIRQFAKTSAPRIAARVLRTRTIARTKGGINVEGAKFRDYTELYKRFRKSHGLPASPVDLYALAQDGQHMLESLDYYDHLTTTAGTGHSLATTPETNPRAVGNQRTRMWLGVATDDIPEVERELLVGYNKLRIGQELPHEPIIA